MKEGDGLYCYERFFPADPLAAFVKFFYYFHGRSDQSERILPQSLAEITFNLGRDGMESFIVPAGCKPYFVVPSGLDRIIGVCLHPWALHALFNLPPGQLGDAKLPLTNVLRIPCEKMTGCITNATSPREMISNLDAYLTASIGDMQHIVIRDAIGFIDRQYGQIKLSQFYQRYSHSSRRLQMLFEESIGLSPKKYSRLKRFHYAVSLLTPAKSLTSLALDAGYYDQAHFVHEFRAFSGTHPRQFLQESNQLNAINARTWF